MMNLSIENILISVFCIILGFFVSKRFSGKYEGDQSRMKSIIIFLGNDKIFWLHHWAFYLLSVILLYVSYIQTDYLLKLFVWLVSPPLMLLMIYLAGLIKSKSHILIFLLISIVSLFSLFNFNLVLTIQGLLIGFVIHGLTYKDRFEFIKNK